MRLHSPAHSCNRFFLSISLYSVHFYHSDTHTPHTLSWTGCNKRQENNLLFQKVRANLKKLPELNELQPNLRREKTKWMLQTSHNAERKKDGGKENSDDIFSWL